MTLVVSDLAERVGGLSRDMMAAAENVAKQSHASATQVLEQTGNWSEANAKRLAELSANLEARTTGFVQASESLLQARSFLTDLINCNGEALSRMTEASRHVQTYSSALAGHIDGIRPVANHFHQTSANIRESFTQHEKLLAEYRKVFDDYKAVFDELDTRLGKVLATFHGGLRDYNQSIENDFREIVRVSNQVVPDISNLLKTQVGELSERFDELGGVISSAMERVNGRVK